MTTADLPAPAEDVDLAPDPGPIADTSTEDLTTDPEDSAAPDDATPLDVDPEGSADGDPGDPDTAATATPAARALVLMMTPNTCSLCLRTGALAPFHTRSARVASFPVHDQRGGARTGDLPASRGVTEALRT